MAFLLGVRPHKRFAAAILSAPLASVAVASLVFGNPFNGAIFSLLAVALAILALRAPPSSPVCFASTPFAVLGAALIAFGLVYPHFLDDAPWFEYFYAAPLGTIPCPTLSLVVGSALIVDAFGLTAWRLLLAATACFYALFGAFRLGVLIDIVLLAGALGLLAQSWKAHSEARVAHASA
ncbi:MAG TPA: hypothetical protein VFK05_17610 [Polyangiaceae bacterium]|nr:hypothetical protein [Polyangiaceae bacterium]